MYSNLLQNEPVIMPWQAYPFNKDVFACLKFLSLKQQFKIDTVIECGSAMGGSTKWFAENFDNVVTIEINPEFQKFCKERTSHCKNIEYVLSDSTEVLGDLLEQNCSSVLLFLDDHWLENLPLMEELRLIAASGQTPVIVIHDFKVPGYQELGFDSYNGQDFEWEWIKPSIEAIYGEDGYDIEYNSQATGAKRGILFITPKERA